MLSNQLACRGLTPPTTTAHRQLHLNLAEAAGTLLDGAANLAVGDSVADTNIHREPCALPEDRQPVE
jgi:hypothetical protein